MIQYDNKNKNFETDGSRPHCHLNLGTLTAVVSDILKNKALSDAENLLITTYTGKWSAKGIAKDMKQHNFLSSNGVAVCHKIPYASVEKALLCLVNKGWAKPTSVLPGGANDKAWGCLSLLLQGLYSSYQAGQQLSDLQSAFTNQKESEVVKIANQILYEFDGADDNLYIGFAQTNSSIGQNIDLHYDIINTGNAPVTSTPRGAALMQLLNYLEKAVGWSPTDQVVVVDTAKVKWAKTSCVDAIGWANVA